MYARRIEPMTDEQQGRLHELCTLPGAMTPRRFWTTILAALAGWVVCVLPLGQKFDWLWAVGVTVLALAVVGATVTQYWADAAALAELERVEHEILADGQVEVTTVESRRAIELAGPENSWINYLFELDDGRVVFLNGPGENDADGPFPNSSFELTTTRVGEKFLGTRCLGVYLDPQLHRAPADLPIDDLPETVVVTGDFEAGVDALLQRVLAAAGPGTN